MRRPLASLLALLTVSASPQTKPQCEAAPVVVQSPGLAPNSTYVSDGEPPLRFSGAPKRPVVIGFGQANIDALCGVPPCGKIFLGCTRDDRMALPDPFSTDSMTFARVVRHELAHVNGWPATHGE